MMYKRNLIKACAVLSAAGVVTVTTGAPAFAASADPQSSVQTESDASSESASSYRTLETDALNSLADTVAEALDEGISVYDVPGQTASGDISLTLDEGMRPLLGLAVPMDVSWLNNVGIKLNVSIMDGIEAVGGNLYLNDVPLTSYELLLDMLNAKEYIKFPELSESALCIDLSDQNTVTAESQLSPEALKKLLENPLSLFPDKETTADLLNRYGSILISHLEECPSEENTSISAAGVTQNCVMYESQLHEGSLKNMLQELLSTARDDSQLEDLISAWSSLAPEPDDVYAQFQSSVDELLTDLEDEDETEENAGDYLDFRLWTDENDNIIGRQFSIFSEGESAVPVFTWLAPKADDTSGFYLEIGSEDDYTTISGTGSTASGKFSGSYDLSVNGEAALSVDVMDYIWTPDENGNVSGSLLIRFPSAPADSADGAAYDPMANISLLLKSEGNQESEEGSLSLSLLSAGTSLGTLKLQSVPGSEAEAPAVGSLDTVYDLESEEDLNAYLSELSFDALLENLRQAGVPEELLQIAEQYLQSLVPAGASAAEAPSNTTSTVIQRETAAP